MIVETVKSLQTITSNIIIIDTMSVQDMMILLISFGWLRLSSLDAPSLSKLLTLPQGVVPAQWYDSFSMVLTG